VVAIAAGFGANYHGSWLLGGAIVGFSILAYVGVGFVLGTQFARRTEDVNALVATFGVPLLMLGGAFVPTFIFPRLLLDLAQYNPIYHMNEALTRVVVDGSQISQIRGHLIFLGLFAVAMVAAGWLSYWRMLQVERRL